MFHRHTQTCGVAALMLLAASGLQTANLEFFQSVPIRYDYNPANERYNRIPSKERTARKNKRKQANKSRRTNRK